MTKCGMRCEVYSRVTGYMRPVNAWNAGKQQEFKDRKEYDARKAVGHVGQKTDSVDPDRPAGRRA